jgi:hypothetical protein
LGVIFLALMTTNARYKINLSLLTASIKVKKGFKKLIYCVLNNHFLKNKHESTQIATVKTHS